MFIINLSTRIRIEIIRRFSLNTEITLSIQFSLGRTPIPPNPELSLLHVNLYLKRFAETNLAEQPFQRGSWKQQTSMRQQPIVSTTSLALPRIVPTYHEDTYFTYLIWSLNGSLDRPTSNLFSTGNHTISIGYGPVVQRNII